MGAGTGASSDVEGSRRKRSIKVFLSHNWGEDEEGKSGRKELSELLSPLEFGKLIEGHNKGFRAGGGLDDEALSQVTSVRDHRQQGHREDGDRGTERWWKGGWP